MKKPLLALFVLFMVGVSDASAQAPPDWTLAVKLGKPLFLTTTSGERVEGVAGQVTPDAVVVSTPVGIRTVTYGELRKAEKRDPVSNGVWIGTGVGLALGLAAVLDADCSSRGCAGEETGVVIGGGLYGALIGWGLDALVKGRTTIFETDRTASLAVVPRRGGVSAVVGIRW